MKLIGSYIKTWQHRVHEVIEGLILMMEDSSDTMLSWDLHIK